MALLDVALALYGFSGDANDAAKHQISVKKSEINVISVSVSLRICGYCT